MRILGAHVGVHSRDEMADRAFFRDVVKLPFVGEAHQFVIFGVPASDIAIHESDGSGHDLYLMCDDVAEFAALMKAKGVAATAPVNRGWGTLMEVTLPGGGKLGVYQPHHERPKMTVKGAPKKATKRAAKKAKAGARKMKTSKAARRTSARRPARGK
ncbi:MAG TPA: hypothetical protein VMH86_05825 [Rhizomicrobium sp.]|nr:hypothetical protein [Rhizomicrobium sp.]